MLTFHHYDTIYLTTLQLQESGQDICSLVQTERFINTAETDLLSLLSADSTKIFPPDFLSIDKDDILNKVITIIEELYVIYIIANDTSNQVKTNDIELQLLLQHSIF